MNKFEQVLDRIVHVVMGGGVLFDLSYGEHPTPNEQADRPTRPKTLSSSKEAYNVLQKILRCSFETW